MTIPHLGNQSASSRVALTPGTRCQVITPKAALRNTPCLTGGLETEIGYGWTLKFLEDAGAGWALMESELDGYEGFVDSLEFSTDLIEPTHRVSALHTIALSMPRYQSGKIDDLFHNALVRIVGYENGFSQIEGSGWVPDGHLTPRNVFDTDPVLVAERYIGAPYQWGGTTNAGIDCSGFVQQVYLSCGLTLPRNSSDQRTWLQGQSVSSLERGDLVFFPGHVVICVGDGEVIHANGDTGDVVKELLSEVILRRGEPTACCRPMWPGK